MNDFPSEGEVRPPLRRSSKRSEIDENFTPKADFFVGWLIVAIGLVVYAKPWAFQQPWFSKLAFVIVVPFILTFFIYGPILLIKTAARSGARGWLVVKYFLAVVFIIVVGLGSLLYIGAYSQGTARLLAMPFLFAAIIYLNRVVKVTDEPIDPAACPKLGPDKKT